MSITRIWDFLTSGIFFQANVIIDAREMFKICNPKNMLTSKQKTCIVCVCGKTTNLVKLKQNFFEDLK